MIVVPISPNPESSSLPLQNPTTALSPGTLGTNSVLLLTSRNTLPSISTTFTIAFRGAAWSSTAAGPTMPQSIVFHPPSGTQSLSEAIATAASTIYIYAAYHNADALAPLASHSVENIATCRYLCMDFTYFALSNGTTCDCGNTLKIGLTPGRISLCNIQCLGDLTEACGGDKGLEILSGVQSIISTIYPESSTFTPGQSFTRTTLQLPSNSEVPQSSVSIASVTTMTSSDNHQTFTSPLSSPTETQSS